MSSEEIRTSQQLANAAETFLAALQALFPGGNFDQFFHGDTVRQAYWAALQETLDCYVTPETALLAQALMSGQVLAEPRVVEELLKLFLPGQTPDYTAVAEHWAAVLAIQPGERATLEDEAQTLFTCLANELQRSADLRLALHELARARYLPDEDLRSTAEQDLGRLLEAALVAGPGTLNLQVRHLLALAAARELLPPEVTGDSLVALGDLAGYLPPDALHAVWKRLDTLDDPALRVRVLARLAPALGHLDLVPDPLTLVQNAIDRSDPPLDLVVCVDTLLDLAPHLAAPGGDQALPSLQQRILAGVQAIADPASRMRALGALIEKLPPDLQRQAVEQAFESVAVAIPHEVARATALSALSPHLPPEFHSWLMSIAYELETPDARALLLGRMIPHMSPPHQLRALTGALDAIEQINGDEARTVALIALAPYIDAIGTLQHIPEGLQQAIVVTFSIVGEDDRARAFAALAPYLSPELLSEALHAIKGIKDDYDRAITLTRFAPHLPADLAVAAFVIAQQLTPSDARAVALSAIAPYLSAAARAQALSDALAAALAIQQHYDRVTVLVDLAPHLSEELRYRALQEALKAARSITDEDERGRALVFLAPHLPFDHLANALADVYTISDPLARVPALCALTPYLPAEPRDHVGQDVINAVREVRRPHDKASLLATAAPVLPDHLLDEAIGAALQIDAPYDRMHVLTALLPRHPERLRDAALAAAKAVPDLYRRVSALLELVPHIPPAQRYPLLDDALETALDIEDDYDRASALAQLAASLDVQGDVQNRQQDALHLALEACFEVADPRTRASLLARLAAVWARLLTPGQSYPLWRQVVVFLSEQPYAEVATDLAALAPVMERMGASGAPLEVVGSLLPLVLSE